MTDLPDNQSSLSDADLDLLSAYLDDALSPAELITLHQRLQQEPELQAALHELQFMQQLLQALPTVPPPRSFTLDPETVAPRSIPLGTNPARWGSNLMLRLGGALTGLVVVLLMVGSMVTLLGGQPQVAQISAPPESASGGGATASTREAAGYGELDDLGGVAGSADLTGDEQSLPLSPGVSATIDTDEAELAPASSFTPQAVPTTFGDLAASDTSSPSTNTTDVQPLAIAPAPTPVLWLPLGLGLMLIGIGIGGVVLWWVRRRQ